MAERGWLGRQLAAWRGTTAAQRRKRLDKERLLARLEPITYTPTPGEQQLFDQPGLDRVLPLLVSADQEHAYQLVREVTTAVLGHVPDPEGPTR